MKKLIQLLPMIYLTIGFCESKVSALTPEISPIPDQVLQEDGVTDPIPFSVVDPDTPTNQLNFSVSSSDTTIVRDIDIIFENLAGNRTMKIRPLPDTFGSLTITLSVDDGVDTAKESFLLTVDPVNDPPRISPILDQEIDEGLPLTIEFQIDDIDHPQQDLLLSVQSDNPFILPDHTYLFEGSQTDRRLTITPEAGQPAPINVLIQVSDGLAETLTSFRLKILPPPNTDLFDVPTLPGFYGSTNPRPGNSPSLSNQYSKLLRSEY